MPAFSPDGKSMAFVRRQQSAGDLYVVPLSENLSPIGEPKRLTFDQRNTGNPAWTPDGRSILYSSGLMSDVSLWRIRLKAGVADGRPEHLPFSPEGARMPAISRQGRLAYSAGAFDVDIWRLDLAGARPGLPLEKAESRLISSTRLDHTPMFSPDGRRVAFASQRSGSHEIWVCDADGRNPLKLTSFGREYTANPNWSSDGQMISFMSRESGRSAAYVIPSRGGTPRRFTPDGWTTGGGSWSRDGKWLYFGAKGKVWKAPASGGDPIEVAHGGDTLPVESADGRFVYYLSRDEWLAPLLRSPTTGGEASQVLPAVFSLNFALVKDGVYFIGEPNMHEPSMDLFYAIPFAVHFLNFSTGRLSTVAKLRGVPAYCMSVSPDRRSILVGEYDSDNHDLMMVDHFE
jgi:Tol biopolymer transport system component